MIRPLRQLHRRLVIALGVMLPVAFVLGLAARKPVPAMPALPGRLAAAPTPFPVTEWERADLFGNVSIPVRLLRESPHAGRFAVAFSAPKDFVQPDLLVYWVADKATLADTLPGNAALLGAFDAFTALALPAEAARQTGQLVLYSLADNAIIEASKPFALSQP